MRNKGETMKKFMVILCISLIGLSCTDMYTAWSCALSIKNDTGSPIWLMPQRYAQQLKEQESTLLREQPNRVKINAGQVWTYPNQYFYIYEYNQNDALYTLMFKVLLHKCPDEPILYSALQNDTVNKEAISVQFLGNAEMRPIPSTTHE